MLRILIPLSAALLSACATRQQQPNRVPIADEPALAGHLLLIGGGLETDNTAVFDRFFGLVRQFAGRDKPRVVIATAATLEQQQSAERNRRTLALHCPDCEISVVTRETPTMETVALVNAAHGLFFTGGDQKRITARYLNAEQDTPESSAMRRLLWRGGVIAGTSAGDAMMSDPMFLTGRSAAALGVITESSDSNNLGAAEPGGEDDRPDGLRDVKLGPQIGKGMGFLPWAITDSHFFERHRFGRLVAALEQSGQRFGIGVSENACVEVDLATGAVMGVGTSESLLVDVRELRRDGLARLGVRTRVISNGTTISLIRDGTPEIGAKPQRPARINDIPTGSTPEERRRSAALFFLAAVGGDARVAARLRLDGYELIGWPDGLGGAIIDILPLK